MYHRKEVIGDCTLYLGDSLQIMPMLEKVDCVVTDPPYPLTSGGNNTSELGGCLSKHNYNNDGKIVECNITWKQINNMCYEALKDNGNAYIMSNNRNLEKALRWFRKSGFGFHNILVWDKCTVTPNRFYMLGVEFGLFGYKGRARYINDMSLSNLFKAPNSKGNEHPTEKPVELMACWIEQSTDKGGLVIDPFMGSGTTLVACAKTGRKGIGIEIDKQYFDVACRRVEFAYRQGSLF